MRQVQSPIEVRVKESSGAYVTATVGGQRCSSTSSAEHAAKGLAVKLWPYAGYYRAEQMTAKGLRAGESIWRLSCTPPAGASGATDVPERSV